MGAVVGIDLGTTNTVVAAVRDGQPTALADETGSTLIPSIVSFMPSGSVLVGATAKDRRPEDPANTVFSVKRLIGRTWDTSEVTQARARFPFTLREGPGRATFVSVRNETYTLPEISAFVLRKAKALAELELGEPVERAVITVPANFNDLQRAATKVAGRVAGLEILRILNEPTAAALAFGHGAGEGGRIAVFDFGGGTFDVTLLTLTDSVFEVLSTAGNTFLGGDDIDAAIADEMANELAAQHGFDPRSRPNVYARLRDAAELVKTGLSTEQQVSLRLENLDREHHSPLGLDFAMTRAELDRLATPIVDRTFDVCREAFGTAHLSVKDLDHVLMVGGSTQMPLVRARVEEFFGRRVEAHVNPHEAVALGAAIQAHSLTARRSAASIPAPPTTSLGLGDGANRNKTHPFGRLGSVTSPGLGKSEPPPPVARLSAPPVEPPAQFTGVTSELTGPSTRSFGESDMQRSSQGPRTLAGVGGRERRSTNMGLGDPTDNDAMMPDLPLVGAGAGQAHPFDRRSAHEIEPPPQSEAALPAPVVPTREGAELPTLATSQRPAAPRQRTITSPESPRASARPPAMGSHGSEPESAAAFVSRPTEKLEAVTTPHPPHADRASDELRARYGNLPLRMGGRRLDTRPDESDSEVSSTALSGEGEWDAALPALSERPPPVVGGLRASVPDEIASLPALSDRPPAPVASAIRTAAIGKRGGPAPIPMPIHRDVPPAPRVPVIAEEPEELMDMEFDLVEATSPGARLPAPEPPSLDNVELELPIPDLPPSPTRPSAAPAGLGGTLPMTPKAAPGLGQTVGIAPRPLGTPAVLPGPPAAPFTAPTVPSVGAALGPVTVAPHTPRLGDDSPTRTQPMAAVAPNVAATATMALAPAGSIRPLPSVPKRQGVPLLIDVTPLSLCVETHGGYCDALLERNAKVPCERTREFIPASAQQDRVIVRVAQGESPRFSENTLLGEIELSGLTPGPRGATRIAVTFGLDSDGCLQVRALDQLTGRSALAELRLTGAPAEDEVARMVARQAAHPQG